MAGTFGQQLAEQNAQQQQGQGLSRTKRVILAEQDAQARREFEALQKQAQDLQTTEFSGLSFEQYTEKYNKLSPQLQQFFASPESIIAERNAKIQVEKTAFQEMIAREQTRLDQAIARKEKYIQESSTRSSDWWHRNRDSYDENIDEYNADIDLYRETINYANQQAGKLDQGATASDVFSYGESKAEYNRRRREARDRAREDFNKQVKTGNLDQDLAKLGLDPKNVDYNKYVQAIDKYNSDVAYKNNIVAWASKVGYDKLPAYAQKIINPSAVEWQGKNPTEKLVFDKVGNVIGVESGKLQQSMSYSGYSSALNKQFEMANPTEKLQYNSAGDVIGVKSGIFGGATLSISEYNAKITPFNEQQKLIQDKQIKNTEEAKKILTDAGFGVGVSLDKPKENWLQQAWSGLKALRFASPFGTSMKVTEKTQQELTDLREQRVGEALTPTFNSPFAVVKGIPTFDIYKFSTLPLQKSWDAIERQEGLDYEQKKAGELLDQLTVISKGGGKTNFDPELTPFIEAEGLKILQEKGLEMKETITTGTPDEYGNPTQISTIQITDPAFDRSISQNMLEWEKEMDKAGYTTKKVPIYESGTSFYKVPTMNVEIDQKTGMIKNQGTAMMDLDANTYTFKPNEMTFSKGEYVPQTMDISVPNFSWGKLFLGTRIVSTSALETYGLMKAVQLGATGVIKVTKGTYDLLGGGLQVEKAVRTGTFTGKAWVSESNLLPKFFTEKTVQLAEGSAIVPRNYGILKTTFGVGLTGLYGFGKYRQYQSYKATSKAGADVFWLESIGELGGIEMATGVIQKTYYKTKNRIDNWNLKTLKQADISQQGFYRMNKRLGFEEKVYMTTAKPFKMMDRSTWNLRGFKDRFGLRLGDNLTPVNVGGVHLRLRDVKMGYQTGAFKSRAYKFLPDELTAYYKYGGNVQVFDKGGKLVKILRSPTEWELMKSGKMGSNVFSNRGQAVYRGRNKITGEFKQVDLIKDTERAKPKLIKELKAEAFPFDNPKTHLKWFIRKNIQQYGVGSYSKLPISTRGKAFGYSATGSEWTATEFKPSDIFFVDKAGVPRTLKTEGAIQYVSGKGVSAGFLRIFKKVAEESAVGKSATDPIIYANYMEQYKLNKAIREIKGIDSAGRELKAYIYTKKASANELNIGGMKKEVEGTIEITKRIPIRRDYAIKLEGWKVPIEEQIFGKVEDLSPNDLKAIIKSMGSVKELSGIAQSSLPSQASRFSGGYGLISYSKPSKSSRSMSEISRVSTMSEVSDISRISSKISELSKISSPSRRSSSSRISEISIGSSIVSDILRRSEFISGRSSPPRSRTTNIPSLIAEKIEQKKQRKFKPTPEFEALFPDFTARAIGLAPKRVGSVKDALREISKIRTGFEIRTGARMSGYSPIDEKSLLRGMMK